MNLKLTLRKTWGDRVGVAGGLYNVFDAQYSDPAGDEHRQAAIPQNGRNWRLKRRYTF